MGFLDQVKSLLGVNFREKARAEIAREEDTAGRHVAMRYSRGSVGIQKNAFQTRRELDHAMSKAGIKR